MIDKTAGSLPLFVLALHNRCKGSLLTPARESSRSKAASLSLLVTAGKTHLRKSLWELVTEEDRRVGTAHSSTRRRQKTKALGYLFAHEQSLRTKQGQFAGKPDATDLAMRDAIK